MVLALALKRATIRLPDWENPETEPGSVVGIDGRE
jgi:hypothetical protein